LGGKKRVNITTTILVIGIIIGATIFLGFYLTSYYDYSILGVPSLEEFLTLLGLIILLICGFFLISHKTNRHQI
jgi:hypothetical protein